MTETTDPAPHPEGPAHRWAAIDPAGVFLRYHDRDRQVADAGEEIVVAPLSPQMARGRWQFAEGRWQPIRWAHLDETGTLVGISDDPHPAGRHVIVPADCDLDSQRGRQRWNAQHGRFEPRTDANDPAVVMVALDALAPRALAHLILGLERAGKPDAYAIDWARQWLSSFDAATDGQIGFVPPQFRG